MLTSEDHLHGLALPHCPHQALGATTPGNGAQYHLGLPKLRLFPRQDDVTHHGQLTPPTQGIAIHGGNEGLGDLCEVRPVHKHVAGVVAREGHTGHLLDVRTRCKGTLTARDHNGPYATVTVEALRGAVYLPYQGRVQGIQGLGAVQCYQTHPSRLCHQN